jgi:hypothetical protein
MLPPLTPHPPYECLSPLTPAEGSALHACRRCRGRGGPKLAAWRRVGVVEALAGAARRRRDSRRGRLGPSRSAPVLAAGPSRRAYGRALGSAAPSCVACTSPTRRPPRPPSGTASRPSVGSHQRARSRTTTTSGGSTPRSPTSAAPSGWAAVGLPSRRTWPAFQDVGDALWRAGWPALLAPSAARPGSLIICVFDHGTWSPAGCEPVRAVAITDVPPPPTGMTTQSVLRGALSGLTYGAGSITWPVAAGGRARTRGGGA